MPVRERNVAMVYQQFINYPSMTVADNIASPLKLRGETGHRRGACARLAATLHIEHFLDRLPAELSGGQQQRVALARALAKEAPLMLLDEPLVNLDYKLREELRDELTPAVRQPATRPSSTPPPSPPRRCCWAATPRCWTRASCCSTGPRPRSSTRPGRSAWRAPSATRR